MPTAIPLEPWQAGSDRRRANTLFFQPAIVIGAEIDAGPVDAFAAALGQRGDPCLGIAAGGGLSPSMLPKVALPVNQR